MWSIIIPKPVKSEVNKRPRDITNKEYKSILKEMPNNKKHALTVLLNEMGSADGTLNKKERKLIANILKKAGV